MTTNSLTGRCTAVNSPPTSPRCRPGVVPMPSRCRSSSSPLRRLAAPNTRARECETMPASNRERERADRTRYRRTIAIRGVESLSHGTPDATIAYRARTRPNGARATIKMAVVARFISRDVTRTDARGERATLFETRESQLRTDATPSELSRRVVARRRRA